MNKEFDVTSFIMTFESEEMEDSEIVYGMQHLINKGLAYSLQGFYGRIADNLIDQGFCKPKGVWTPEEAREQFLSL